MRRFYLHTGSKYIFKTLVATVAFVQISSVCTAWNSDQTIKVAIFRGQSVKVQAEGGRVTGITGNEKTPFYSDSEFSIKSGGKSVFINGVEYASLIIDAGAVGVVANGNRYRGRIHIMNDRSSLLMVNEIHLEDYLVGLINEEISSKWPVEVVKAQAVVARTYALYQKKMKNRNYDVESDVTSQVYSGIESEDGASLKAVKDTEGEVALYQGELIQALYHSSCGGKTENARDVWGQDVPYLKCVKDKYCTEAPNFFWQYSISSNDLAGKLRKVEPGITSVKGISVLRRSESGRVLDVRLNVNGRNINLSGREMREAVGHENIKSTNFSVKMKGESFSFAGSGGGHGVGMCQWGAKGMAEEGRNYKEILKSYYPGITIRRYTW